jgi:hypothetical protein
MLAGDVETNPGPGHSNIIDLTPENKLTTNALHLDTERFDPTVLPTRQRVLTTIRTTSVTTVISMLLNVRSIANKALILNHIIAEKKLDLAIFTETWVKKSDPTYHTIWNELLPVGYHHIHKCRPTVKRGGVLLQCFRLQ